MKIFVFLKYEFYTKYLENNRINILVLDFSKVNDKNMKDFKSFNMQTLDKNGKIISTILNPNIGLNSEIINNNKTLINAFIHELVHSKGLDEFQAFSTVFSMGLMSREDIKKQLVHYDGIMYVTKGMNRFYIHDYFELEKSLLLWDLQNEETQKTLKWEFKEGKEDEFFELMEKEGNKVRGS